MFIVGYLKFSLSLSLSLSLSRARTHTHTHTHTQSGEVWYEVAGELAQEGLRPVTPDQECLTDILQTHEEKAEETLRIQVITCLSTHYGEVTLYLQPYLLNSYASRKQPTVCTLKITSQLKLHCIIGHLSIAANRLCPKGDHVHKFHCMLDLINTLGECRHYPLYML